MTVPSPLLTTQTAPAPIATAPGSGPTPTGLPSRSPVVRSIRVTASSAALERSGHVTGAQLFALMDVAQDVVAPLMPREQLIDRTALSLGYAGVYSSFLLHAERAAERYKVPAHEILRRCGELGYVGGQEDMIIDVAAELAGHAGG